MGESIWTYDPNYPVSIVFAAFYAIPLFVQGYQTFVRYRSYYFWVVFVGALLEVGGYAARTVAIKHLDQIVRNPQRSIIGDHSTNLYIHSLLMLSKAPS